MTAQRNPRNQRQPYHLDPRPPLNPPALHETVSPADHPFAPLPSRVRATHGEGRGGERERLPSLPDQGVDLSLTPSARRLARWLEKHLHTTGARAMIRRYGTAAVLEALHDGIIVRTRWGWAVRQELRSPGGFLRWLLQQGETP